MNTITVNGYNGTEDDQEQGRRYEAKLHQTRSAVADGTLTVEAGAKAFSDWLDHHFSSFGAARYHNAIATPLARFARLRRIGAQRVREADDAYADLEKRTTTAWHAAHHRYILAATAARTALAEMVEAANEVAAAAGADIKYVTRELYEKMVPAADRHLDLPDLAAVRADLDGFVETQRQRFATTAHTLAGTTPTGFEPPAPEPTAPQPDADEDADGYSSRRW